MNKKKLIEKRASELYEQWAKRENLERCEDGHWDTSLEPDDFLDDAMDEVNWFLSQDIQALLPTIGMERPENPFPKTVMRNGKAYYNPDWKKFEEENATIATAKTFNRVELPRNPFNGLESSLNHTAWEIIEDYKAEIHRLYPNLYTVEEGK